MTDQPGLIKYGYAPGEYINNCLRCGDNFLSEKNCRKCKPCAEIEKEKARKLDADQWPPRITFGPEGVAMVIMLLAQDGQYEEAKRECVSCLKQSYDAGFNAGIESEKANGKQ